MKRMGIRDVPKSIDTRTTVSHVPKTIKIGITRHNLYTSQFSASNASETLSVNEHYREKNRVVDLSNNLG